jgi:hypothetical protein
MRAVMRNSWNQSAMDSIVVHRSGAPATVEVVAPLAELRAGDRRAEWLQVRILDAWGVPVPGALATVRAEGARLVDTDADPTSVGLQLAAGRDGHLAVAVQALQEVGLGEVQVRAGDAIARVPVRTLPTNRPIIAVGTAQLGLGATHAGYGAITVHGAIGAETSVSISYDSRRGAHLEDFFARGLDPLDEGYYPVLGDASERRTFGGSTQSISARLEHRQGWVEAGDIDTGAFVGSGRLGSYRRAVTGVGARHQVGVAAVQAFGSVTDQVLSQIQVRADGSSGPFRLGGDIRPGTERLSVEVRAADNAARVIAREVLTPHVDYLIDYSSGDVLLYRAIPSMDGAGNHLFIVATVERRTGAERSLLGGVRLDLDAGRLLGSVDSLHVYALAVHDGSDGLTGTASQDLIGAGASLRHGGYFASGEVITVPTRENALASTAVVGWSLREDAAHIRAEWTRITAGFDPMADPRLGSGLQELRVTGGMRVSAGSLVRLTHSRQRFESFNVERQNTVVNFDQQVLGRTVSSQAGLSTDVNELDHAASLLTGRVRVPLADWAAVWVEGAHALPGSSGDPSVSARPSHVGLGATYDLHRSTQLELAQRWVGIGDSRPGYSLTSLRVRNQSFLGAVWGGLEHAAAEESASAVNLGWNPRLTIARGWTLHAMLERKFGLERAPLLDIHRALPFPQLERDRWSTALGMQWIAADTLSRFRIQGEMHGGEMLSGHRVEILGEVQPHRAVALMTQHDWWRQDRALSTDVERSRRDRSVLGVALRPTEAGTLNVLSKLEWRRSVNPIAGSRFSHRGEDQRVIGMVDAIWSAGRGSEVLGRYAVRSRQISNRFVAVGAEPEGEIAHYLGGRVGQHVHGPVTLRLDGRALVSGGFTTWNVAPSVALRLNQYLEVEGGYRFGNMQDVDFAAHGDRGLFITVGVQFTEQISGRIAEFWRHRIAAGQ